MQGICFYLFLVFDCVCSVWSFGLFMSATLVNDLHLERFSIPDFIHYFFCPILILVKEPVFPFLCLVLNKETTGTNFITSLVWCNCWLGEFHVHLHI